MMFEVEDGLGILIVSATPERISGASGPHESDAAREIRDVQDVMAASPGKGGIRYHSVPAVTWQRLHDALLRFRPGIVHIIARGDTESIELESDERLVHRVSAADLASLLGKFRDSVRLVVYSACESSVLATATKDEIGCAIGFDGFAMPADTRSFAAAFYRNLVEGVPCPLAFERAKAVTPRARPVLVTADTVREDADPGSGKANSVGEARNERTAYDAVLCYDGRDRQAVEALARDLVERGIRPWFDKWHLRAGRLWSTEVRESLAQTLQVIVCVGKSEPARHCEPEVPEPMSQAIRDPKRPVIVVMLEEGPLSLPPFLVERPQVDLQEDREAGLRAIGGLLGVSGRGGQVQHTLQLRDTGELELSAQLGDCHEGPITPPEARKPTRNLAIRSSSAIASLLQLGCFLASFWLAPGFRETMLLQVALILGISAVTWRQLRQSKHYRFTAYVLVMVFLTYAPVALNAERYYGILVGHSRDLNHFFPKVSIASYAFIRGTGNMAWAIPLMLYIFWHPTSDTRKNTSHLWRKCLYLGVLLQTIAMGMVFYYDSILSRAMTSVEGAGSFASQVEDSQRRYLLACVAYFCCGYATLLAARRERKEDGLILLVITGALVVQIGYWFSQHYAARLNMQAPGLRNLDDAGKAYRSADGQLVYASSYFHDLGSSDLRQWQPFSVCLHPESGQFDFAVLPKSVFLEKYGPVSSELLTATDYFCVPSGNDEPRSFSGRPTHEARRSPHNDTLARLKAFIEGKADSRQSPTGSRSTPEPEKAPAEFH
jgi:hypothetical protein